MALPNSQPDTGQGPGPNFSKPFNLPRLSYSKIVQKHRQSLMHKETETVLSPTDSDARKSTRIILSNIWRVGGSPASVPSVFFDVSSRTETLKRILSLVAQTFPDNCGAEAVREGPRVLIELYLESPTELERAITQGLPFKNNVIIKACKALADQSQIKKVRLSKLPFMNETKLVAGILQSLSLYGHVLDCGIYKDADSGLFMGNGFAILDRQSVANEQPYSEMAHVIPWCTTIDRCYATWATMPLTCSLCHTAGHSVATCPQGRAATRTCWTCGTSGHISRDCPEKNTKFGPSGGKRRRNNNRGPKPNTSRPTPMRSSPAPTRSSTPLPLDDDEDNQSQDSQMDSVIEALENLEENTSTGNSQGATTPPPLTEDLVLQRLQHFEEHANAQPDAYLNFVNHVSSMNIEEDWHQEYPLPDAARQSIINMDKATQNALAAYLRTQFPSVPAESAANTAASTGQARYVTSRGRIVQPTEKALANSKPGLSSS